MLTLPLSYTILGKVKTRFQTAARGAAVGCVFARTMYQKPTTKKAIAIAAAGVAAAAALAVAASDIYPPSPSGVRARDDDHDRGYR